MGFQVSPVDRKHKEARDKKYLNGSRSSIFLFDVLENGDAWSIDHCGSHAKSLV